MLRVAERRIARQHLRSQRPQPVNDRSRLVEPSHMSVARSEPAVGPWPDRGLLRCHEQLCRRLIEAAKEEVCDAEHPEVVADTGAWAEAERLLHLLDGKAGLARPDTEGTPQIPRPRKARIERKSTIDQRYLGTDIFAEKGERKRGVREDARVVASGFHCLPSAAGLLQSRFCKEIVDK